MLFTFSSLPLNFYTSVSGCGFGFGFEQKIWRIDGFGKNNARIGGFAYPYSPPSIKKHKYCWYSLPYLSSPDYLRFRNYL